MDRFTRSYIECALWSSMDDNGEPLDETMSGDDMAPETLADMIADCADFQGKAGDMMDECGEAAAGHDFWLTRNGHGAGFWDGDWPENGDALDKLSKEAGPYSLYVGDDGKLYGLRSE